jgi:hypothetical protein
VGVDASSEKVSLDSGNDPREAYEREKQRQVEQERAIEERKREQEDRELGPSNANVPDFLYPLRLQTNHYSVDVHTCLARVWLPLEISGRIAQDVQMQSTKEIARISEGTAKQNRTAQNFIRFETNC